MTSTNTYKGMDSDTKPSSRVLAPPGGGSSNIFGVDTPAPVRQPPKPQPVEKQENILGQPPQNQSGRNIRAAPKQEYNPITGEPYPSKTPIKADAKADGDKETKEADGSEDQTATTKEEQTPGKDNQNSKPAPENEVKEHTSTRVLNPPGGKSTKLW